jgi:glutathione S-transferase
LEDKTKPKRSAAVITGRIHFRDHAAVLNTHLEHRRWLLGDAISYADFRVATPLPFAGPAGIPLSDFANVKRWHDQLLEIDAWRDPFNGLD